MKEEKTKKLSALVWRSRIRLAVPIIATLAISVSGLVWYIAELKDAKSSLIVGAVNSWSKAQSNTGSPSYVIDATLPDGSRVTATANQHGRAPVVGEKIELIKIETPSGDLRYRWSRGISMGASQ